MKGPHTHEWRYNEAKFDRTKPDGEEWFVIRFCTYCLELEVIELKHHAA